MATALDKYVPTLDGTNYQVWSRQMKSFLQSLDLWLTTSGTWTRPVPADPANITPAEQERINSWDASDERAQGNITLTLAPWVQDKVRREMTLQNLPETAHTIWEQVRAAYSAVSPAQVFGLFRQVMTYRIDVSKNIVPQMDALNSLYQRLAAETVDIPDFLRAMMLMSALPPAWEAPIIVSVMAGGTIASITLENTVNTIARYANAERAKKVGKHVPKVNKLSAVKRKGDTPSFQQQTKPHGGGKSKKGKKPRGDRGKGPKKGKGYGNLHIANSISRMPPSAHSIATITPQGVLQRIEVEEPETSSFGRGPYASFNNAMSLADCLDIPKTQRNVQRLKVMTMDCPGPSTFPGSFQDFPESAPTPEGSRPSTPRSPTWPHMSQSEKDGIAPLVAHLTKKRAATAPPMVPEHELTDQMMEDDVSIPDSEDETLWGKYIDECRGASGIEYIY